MDSFVLKTCTFRFGDYKSKSFLLLGKTTLATRMLFFSDAL